MAAKPPWEILLDEIHNLTTAERAVAKERLLEQFPDEDQRGMFLLNRRTRRMRVLKLIGTLPRESPNIPVTKHTL